MRKNGKVYRVTGHQELMLCVIDISTLNKTYLIWTTTDNTRGIHFRLVQKASCVYNSSIHLAEISDLLYSTAE